MIIATLLAAALLTALITAGLAMIKVATTREYRAGRLQARATTPLAAIARKVTGLYVEIPPAATRPDADRIAIGAGAQRPGADRAQLDVPNVRDNRVGGTDDQAL